MKKWIVTYVDYGETCDGKARCLGVFDTKEAAVEVVVSDIRTRTANAAEPDSVIADYGKMSISNADSDGGCEWNVEEIEL